MNELTDVAIPYTPRPLQREVGRLCRAKRFGVLVCHRRFGKTVFGVNINQQTALMCAKERPRVAYIGPTYTQGKAVAWDFMQHYARPVPGVAFNQSELRIDYPNEGQARIFGADNPDALRGIYLDRAVLDEFGLHPAKTFSEVIGPTLVDRGGSALFLGTPNGKNQFYDIAQHAKAQEAAGDPQWFFREYKASQTGLLDAAYLAQAKSLMTDDEYAQEFECSFEAAVKGAIFAKELEAARQGGRVGIVPHDPILKVDTFWDLGFGGQGDATAIWFVQRLRTQEIRLIDYYEAQGEGLPHYAQMLASKGYIYGQHWAPHDIKVKEASGKTRIETARSLGITFHIAPDVSIEDGIHSARMIFPRCYFDAVKCRAGLDALMHYKRDYNVRLNEFKATPVHDWASHACLVAGTLVRTNLGELPIEQIAVGMKVWTPRGYSNVTASGPSKQATDLVRFEFSDGRSLTCTPEHKILTDCGFLPADTLRYTTRLFTGGEWICRLIAWCSMVVGIGFRAAITGERLGTAQGHQTFTERFGNFIMGLFRSPIISTTSMGMAGTTMSPTWPALVEPHISERTRWPLLRRGFSSLHPLVPSNWPLNPSEIQQAMPIGVAHHGKRGSVGNGIRVRVRTAVSHFCRRILRGRSGAISIAKWRRFDVGAERPWVYDLSVENHACYQANGVLVSNSDAFRYLAVSIQPEKDRGPKGGGPPLTRSSGDFAWAGA